jgi:type III secretion protein J
MRAPTSFFLLLFVLVGCGTRIQHGLDERQANEICAALVERGMAAKKVSEGGKRPTWAVEVDEERATGAVKVLAELGLPKAKNEGFQEIFGKGSLVPSPTEERALFLEALSGEVARTLEAVDGVVSARVHVVLPQTARGQEHVGPSKAAALLRVRVASLERLNQERMELKALIAGGVEGLAPENVTLVLDEVVGAVEGRHEEAARADRLKALTETLGVVASVLGVAVVALSLHRRGLRAEVAVLRTSPGHSRSSPTPQPSQARRVA